MDAHELRALVLQHAAMLADVHATQRSASLLESSGQVDQAEMLRDEAAEMAFRARALGKLLGPHGVAVPDPDSLSLLAVGTVAPAANGRDPA